MMTAIAFGSTGMVSTQCPAKGCGKYADHVTGWAGSYTMSHDCPRTTSGWWPPPGHMWQVTAGDNDAARD